MYGVGVTSQTDNRDQWNARQQSQASAFDQIGGQYDLVFPHKEGQKRIIELLLQRLPEAARVLDLGCGTGLPTARILAKQGHQVTGVDLSPVMVELASRNVPEATFLCQDFSSIDSSFGEFDAVIGFFSLLMLPRKVIRQVLANVREMLSPSGCLALGMVEADLDDVPIPFLGCPVLVSGWPAEQLREELQLAGFSIKAEATYSYEPAAPGVPPETQLYLLATP
jgi:SAM-dependent methyltransferase